jgi:hypothetical protein
MPEQEPKGWSEKWSGLTLKDRRRRLRILKMWLLVSRQLTSLLLPTPVYAK